MADKNVVRAGLFILAMLLILGNFGDAVETASAFQMPTGSELEQYTMSMGAKWWAVSTTADGSEPPVDTSPVFKLLGFGIMIYLILDIRNSK